MHEITQEITQEFVPLVQEFEKVEAKFLDPERVKHVIEWYREQKDWFLEQIRDPHQAATWRKNNVMTLALGSDIPGMLQPEKSSLDMLLGNLTSDYAEKINSNPTLILEVVRKFGKDKMTEDYINGKPTTGLLEALGLTNASSITESNLRLLVKVVLDQYEKLLPLLYYYQVVEDSIADIQMYVPSLKDKAEKIFKNCLIVNSNSSRYFAITINNRYVINLPYNDESPDERLSIINHFLRKLILGHELMHSITSELFNLSADVTDKEIDFDKPQSDLLGGGIFEGISFAYEAEVVAHAKPEEQAAYKKWFRDRINVLHEVNRDFGKFKWDQEIPLTTEEENHFEYALGARLAFALRKNGWQLNDLNVLIPKIKEIMLIAAGVPAVTEPLGINPWQELFETGKYGTPQYINAVLARIAELKPKN